MFQNVLIAEDHQSINISVRKTLDDLGITNKIFMSYCDEAYKLTQINIKHGNPFDLLITDLSFDEDQNKQAIGGGKELISMIKTLQPNLKIIVFSHENNIDVVDELFDVSGIDGYVRKGRNDAEDLRRAIENVSQNRRYRTAELRHNKRIEKTYDFKIIDIEIITLLCDGRSQKEIPDLLKKKNLTPSGLSSIEKRLNHIKTALEFSNNGQLIAYCKDKKII
jgi:two-component system capsular synthesis response regulator RcsB